MKTFFCQALSGKESFRERRKLEDLFTYLFRDWEGIQNARRYQVEVSALAHVSHVLSLGSPIVP